MLPDRWYPILESDRLRRRPVGATRLGRRLVVWRDGTGGAVALPAACPHRGAALDRGRVVDGELACPWHGFRFAADGRCTRMPCAGLEARVPRALDLQPLAVREGHGLVWLWWGAPRTEYPPLPYFGELDPDLRGTAQASYVLPYHYTRMIETNLDIHHTPFVHGSLFPVGARVEPFEAHVDGDRIETRGELRREGAATGMPFRDVLLLPCLNLIELTEKLRLVVSSTPVDEGHTWVWFRYHHDYTRLPGLRKLLAWIAVQAELRFVQPQDWRIFASLPPGTIDDVPYRFVHADQGIALYRKRRAELLAAAAPAALRA
jgi:phenylpropionate dioxygenase-like ring-hydroxylating dioxygenase large terminal subunit